MTINITKKTSTANTTVLKGRKILYIVEHYTAGVTSKSGSAANIASYFGRETTQASADFIVDDANIIQYNPDPENRYCWAVGGNSYGNKGGSLYGVAKNANSISVEICSTNDTGKVTNVNDSHWSFTDSVLDKAVELTRYLMKKYGIDADHVIRHYDVNGKPCPGIIGWNAETGDESKWKAFKKMLYASGVSNTGLQANSLKNLSNAAVNFTPYKVKVKIDNLNIRTKPTIDGASVGYTKKGVFTIVAEKTGKISENGEMGTWGLLKSYEKKQNGWICLAFKSYTEKV
jgi:N-acetylmuramoyl-L-alanine amidase CwlA